MPLTDYERLRLPSESISTGRKRPSDSELRADARAKELMADPSTTTRVRDWLKVVTVENTDLMAMRVMVISENERILITAIFHNPTRGL